MDNIQDVMTKDDHIMKLNNFLVDNIELEILSAKLASFNILKVLKIENTEIRHSNVLAWLMQPQESHGIGQAFIKRFLSTILLDANRTKGAITPAQIELMDLSDVEVRREWRKTDLIVISEKNRLLLLIENKMRAKATKRQLLKYIEIVKKEFPKHKDILPVLLTKDDDGSDVAEDVGYIPWNYVKTLKIIEQIKSQRQDRIPGDANVF